jgi:uncharacterized protein
MTEWQLAAKAVEVTHMTTVTDQPLTGELAAAAQTVGSLLKAAAPLGVAFSGGVDSSVLLALAVRALGADQVIAILGVSPSLASDERLAAHQVAAVIGARIVEIQTREADNPAYRANGPDRCFHCKDELFTEMERFRNANEFKAIAYGVNVDDQGDYRPGQNAARQHQVAAPLLDAGLTKADIRQLASEAGLRVWDKPASACLSSRIEYGRPVTRQALTQIEAGEDALRQLGFRQFRVRHHGQIVRIEIAAAELPRALTPEMSREFVRLFKKLGFDYITLDLEGFRSGSMNAVLPISDLKKVSDLKKAQ